MKNKFRETITKSGATFCQVASNKQLSHERPLITPGSQKWSGAAPNFRERPRKTNNLFHLKEDVDAVNPIKRIRPEPIA